MKQHHLTAGLIAAGMALNFGSSAVAGGGGLTTERIASGLTRPLYVTHAPGDFDRIFILEQRSGTTGRIRIMDINTDTLQSTPFLNITGVFNNI